MRQPALGRYGQLVRYDRERGALLALDLRRYPDEAMIARASAEAAAQGVDELAQLDRRAAVYAAGYALALAAREWCGRPSDGWRAAMVQAAQRLRRPSLPGAAALLAACLARADAAIVGGADAEAAILDVVDAEVRRGDRAAERCGRHASGLLGDGDLLLVYGFPGPALAWTARAAAEGGARAALRAAGPTAHLVVAVAHDLGLEAAALSEAQPAEPPALCLVGAERVAQDGSVVVVAGARRFVEQMRGRGAPCYVLSPDGLDPTAPGRAALAAGEDGDLLAPELVSAIATDRGIYRPAMIARYLGDGAAPPDVIPLLN